MSSYPVSYYQAEKSRICLNDIRLVLWLNLFLARVKNSFSLKMSNRQLFILKIEI